MNEPKRNPLTILMLCLLAISLMSCGDQGKQDRSATGAVPTPSAVTEIAGPEPSVSGILTELQGLELDAFFDASYNRLLQRDPELLSELGLTEAFGIGHDQLTDISDGYLRETQELEAAILAVLDGYELSTLTAEQQLSVEIYSWYLDDRVRGHEFMYRDFPVTHFITGAQNGLIQFFTDIHPIASKSDAEDYVSRLAQVNLKFEQLIAGLTIREQEGVILPRLIIQWVLRDLRDVAGSIPRATPFYISFEEKTAGLAGLNEAERGDLLAAAEQEIDESVLPAFQALVDFFEHQELIASNDIGVWTFPDGAAYYEYALRHHTTTNLSVDEIHALGLEELERIHDEMRVLFDQLGYPQDEGLPQLFERVVRDGGTVAGEQIVAEYERIIEAAKRDVSAAFDLRPRAEVVVIGGPTGGYYSAPAVDGSRPGAFYARATGVEPKFGMPTLAYHEAIPGHHFQIAIAQELDIPNFRKGVSFTAYVEGWALYAERLAWELGFYQDDPYGNLGRLQGEAFRAARLVVDTGIHAKKWTYDQAVEFMLDNTGLSRGMVEFEVSRYATWPGQATAYMVGMLKILELRQNAMEVLGDRFELSEFHNVILANGRMPLDVLEQVVNSYIEAESAR